MPTMYVVAAVVPDAVGQWVCGNKLRWEERAKVEPRFGHAAPEAGMSSAADAGLALKACVGRRCG